MKKIPIHWILAGMLAFTALEAQNITFRVEVNQLYLPDMTNLNRDNYNQDGRMVTVYGSTVTSFSALESVVDEFLTNSGSGDPVAAFNSFVSSSVFSGPSAGNAWNAINVSPGIGPAANFDWNSIINALTPDSHPVLLVTTQPLGSLTSNDFIGLVFSDYQVPPLGDAIVGFNSGSIGARWTEVLIGESPASLVLAAIPEPAATTALIGLLGMVFVLIRRRAA